MTLPSRQSGRFESQSSSRESSRRLAADYNLEHAPLQSGETHEDSKGLGFLRDLSAGIFAGGRFAAGILLLFLLIIMAIVFRMTAESVFKDLGQMERRDPMRSAEEPPNHQTIIETPEELPGKQLSGKQPKTTNKNPATETPSP